MDVEEAAAAIREMRIRGAGRIARAGASALADYASSHSGCGMEEFMRGLGSAAETILASRPTAVSLRNGVEAAVRGAGSAADAAEAAETVVRNAARFCRSSEEAVEAIGRIGAAKVRDGDVLMTHCNSSAALAVIKAAASQGKSVRVYATESRPWGQGILTVNQLAAAGVDVTLIIDSAVRHVMPRVDAVFVGADTVTSEGSLVNKIGTSQVALAAHEARVPFYACAETYKLSPATVLGDPVPIEERGPEEVLRGAEVDPRVKVLNPVFDVTPAEHVTALVTELGVVHPAAAYGLIERMRQADEEDEER